MTPKQVAERARGLINPAPNVISGRDNVVLEMIADLAENLHRLEQRPKA